MGSPLRGLLRNSKAQIFAPNVSRSGMKLGEMSTDKHPCHLKRPCRPSPGGHASPSQATFLATRSKHTAKTFPKFADYFCDFFILVYSHGRVTTGRRFDGDSGLGSRHPSRRPFFRNLVSQ